MATPFRIIDRRGSDIGYRGNNKLIESATQNTDRQRVSMLDSDFHRTITSYGRRVLLSLGRHMFFTFPALQGAILEQANVSVSTFIPQYTGRNSEWGKLAESALAEWHKIMDLAGWPYDYDSFLQGKVINPIVDGEDFTLLTENADGYPLVQIIPAHRIGSNETTAAVRFFQEKLWIDEVLIDDNRPSIAEDSITFDAPIVDGVICDFYGRAIAYRVNSDEAQAEYQDISARNLFPSFCPMTNGQVRGFSLLASSVFDWQDMHEWKRFEMLAQKAAATQGIMETNETGDVDTAKAVIGLPATFDSDGKKTSLDVQTLEGGTIKYFKAGTGSKLEAFTYDRPGGNSQNFLKQTLRDAFKGTEWDVFFSLDPQAVGGAPMRIIVEKINLVAAKRRKLVKKACLRVDGYALSKLIKLGILPPDEDWYRWDYQGPAEITADKKYDSDVDLQEISQGIATRKDACARRGLYMDDVDSQREMEADSDLTRAGRLAAKHGITIQEALVVLRPPNVNQQLPQSQNQAKPSEGDNNP